MINVLEPLLLLEPDLEHVTLPRNVMPKAANRLDPAQMDMAFAVSVSIMPLNAFK